MSTQIKSQVEDDVKLRANKKLIRNRIEEDHELQNDNYKRHSQCDNIQA